MRGFTLVELLVYVALFAIILTLAVQFVLGIIESGARMNAKEEVQKNAAAMIQSFDTAARHASAIYTPTSDFSSDPGQLSLVSRVNLPPNEAESYIDIYMDDESRFCVKREVSGVNCVTSLSVEVTSLDFDMLDQGNDVESVRMTAILRFKSPRSEYYFTETIWASARLRAY